MRSFCPCGLALILALGFPASALAQESSASASDIALARSLGSEGVQLADAGNCPAAIEKLQRAEALYHAPTMLVRLGECQVAVGKVVTGTENLQRVVRESLPAKAPKAYVDAQARAQKALASALPKVARLKIHVDAPPGVRPSVKLDGESIPLAALDVDRPADPGVHQIEVSAPGFLTARQDANLQEGATGSATLRLEPDLSAAGQPPMAPSAAPGAPPMQGQYAPPGSYAPMPPPSPPIGGAMPPPGQEPASGSSQKTVGIVLLGVGGAGLIVGSAFGGVAMSKKKSLDDQCTNGKDRCPAPLQGDLDSLKTSATVSTVGFAIGGVGVAAGLIVFLTAKPGAGTGQTDRAPLRASITPLVGPRSLGVSGFF